MLPRVSTILKTYWPDMYASEDALASGTFRHDLIEQALNHGDLSYMDEDPKLVGLKKWLDEELVEVFYVEELFKNETLGYVGHPDAVLSTKTYGTAIFDWKSNPVPTKGNLMQAQAYSNFLWPTPYLKCHLVHLCGETVKVTKFEPDPHLWAGFLNGLKFLQSKDALK